MDPHLCRVMAAGLALALVSNAAEGAALARAFPTGSPAPAPAATHDVDRQAELTEQRGKWPVTPGGSGVCDDGRFCTGGLILATATGCGGLAGSGRGRRNRDRGPPGSCRFQVMPRT